MQGSEKMGENKAEKTQKPAKSPKASWFSGLKTEFKKIVWPDKESLTRQTVAVVCVSLVLGLIIALLDLVIKYGVDFLVSL